MQTFTAVKQTYVDGEQVAEDFIELNGLDEGKTDTGRVVLQSTEHDIGAIRGKHLLPFSDYHVQQTVTEVLQPTLAGRRSYSPDHRSFEQWSGNADVIYGLSPVFGDAPTIDYGPLKQEAHAEANSAAFDLLTNLAELPETVGMLREVFSNLRSRGQRIAGLRKVRAARFFEEFVSLFSGAWLEYRYGWRPLVGAFSDLKEATRILDQPSPIIVVHGKGKFEVKSSEGCTASWADNSFGGYTEDTYARSSYVARSTVVHAVRREAAAIGFNPILTAWELVPYSFVLDMFVDVGQAIAASYKPFGILETTAGSSLRTTREAFSTRTHAPLEDLIFTPGVASLTHEEYLRWDDPTGAPPPALFSNADRLGLAQITDLLTLGGGLLAALYRGSR